MISATSRGMPTQRRVHIKLSSGEEVIIPFFVLDEHHFQAEARIGELLIPSKLKFDAVWLYDIDERKILKNATGKPALVHLGVREVTRVWLGERGYIRMRRPAM